MFVLFHCACPSWLFRTIESSGFEDGVLRFVLVLVHEVIARMLSCASISSFLCINHTQFDRFSQPGTVDSSCHLPSSY